MTALAELVRGDQAAALARLRVALAVAPPPPAEPTSAACRACGQLLRPVPAAVFAAPDGRS